MTQAQYDNICIAIKVGLPAMAAELIDALNNVISLAQNKSDKEKEVN